MIKHLRTWFIYGFLLYYSWVYFSPLTIFIKPNTIYFRNYTGSLYLSTFSPPKSPEGGTKHGLKPRHRILLYGPPGCGKSLGAERLAWNTGLPLRKVRFDTLLSSYFGETMANLRKVFDAAKTSPCALFLDECDTLARSRTAQNDVGEVMRITNGLLEMLENHSGDGLIIAATNLDSALDTALFRRFDEVLKIPLPGIEEICQLLQATLSSMETEPSLSWREIGSGMDGLSGSEVVRVAQNAAKHSVLEGQEFVSGIDIRFAFAEMREREHLSS